MTASSNLPAPNLMPLMRYRDLAEAMSWLEQAFEFEKQVAVSDGDGSLIYGQMTYRGSLMMMGAVRDTDLDKLMRQPDEVGGVETQSCYIVVEDADAHFARAQEAGAEIVLELKSDGLGRRGYSCRDPQGHIWNFGTYNPAKGLASPVVATAPIVDDVAPRRAKPRMLMGIAALLLALGGAGWWFSGDIAHRVAIALDHKLAAESERAYMELAKVRAEKRTLEGAAQDAKGALDAERQRRLALETGTGAKSDKLAHEESARRAAEAAVASLRDELKRKQDALEDAIEAKRVSEEKLAVMSAAAAATTQTAKAAPEPSTAATGAGDGATGTSEIETSATRPVVSAEPAVEDDDDDAKTSISNKSKAASRAAKRVTQRRKPEGRGPNGFPEYATEMHQTWPYNSWSKRRTNVTQ
jgi:uncharacterized glyoxalase superfamily protein PhnB